MNLIERLDEHLREALVFICDFNTSQPPLLAGQNPR